MKDRHITRDDIVAAVQSQLSTDVAEPSRHDWLRVNTVVINQCPCSF